MQGEAVAEGANLTGRTLTVSASKRDKGLLQGLSVGIVGTAVHLVRREDFSGFMWLWSEARGMDWTRAWTSTRVSFPKKIKGEQRRRDLEVRTSDW